MSDRLCVGLVGAGIVAKHHVAGWQACKGAHLVAVADPSRARAEKRAHQAGGVPVFESLEEMAANTKLDAVDIVAPVSLHDTLIRQALAFNYHVICQKPLVQTAAQGVTLLADLPSTPRVMVHENWRWRTPYQALKTMDLSSVESFEMRVESSGLLKDASGHYPALQRQPFFAALDRFLVLEVLIHHLDTLSFLFGPLAIQVAELRGRCPDMIGEDYAHITLKAGPLEGTLVGDFCATGAPPLPRDRLRINGPVNALVDGWSLQIGDEPNQCWNAETCYQDSYTATIQHFVDALRSEESFATPPEAGIKLLQMVEEIYELGGWNR